MKTLTKQQAIAIRELNGEPTMSSLRIAEITGKEHSKVTGDIERILTEAEISPSEFGVSYHNRGKEYRHYLLPEFEFNLVISGYSVKYRATLIKELMSYRKQVDTNKLSRELTQLEELTLSKMKNEIAILEVNKEKAKQELINKKIETAKVLQEMGANFDPVSLAEGEMVSMLPKDVGMALSNAMSDIRTGVQVFSVTHLLIENEISLRAKDFNDAMISAGFMEKYFHNNKAYKKMVNGVNYYGYNRDSSSIKKLPFQVRLYEDRFMQLVQLLRNDGYLD